ncbi:MAG: hypothetical protein R3F20_02375 [Planctomycetota bacterium]
MPARSTHLGPRPVLLALLASLVLLGGCGGDGGGFTGATASAVIGAAGGQVSSADGRLVLDIPAGALGNDETITITAIGAADLSGTMADFAPQLAWRLEPDGLVFAQPVAITLDLGAAPAEVAGVSTFEIPAVATQSLATGFDLVDLDDIEVDLALGTVMATGTISHFSDIGVQSSHGVTVTLEHPTSIAQGASAPITATAEVAANNTVGTSMVPTWDVIHGPDFATDGLPEPFGPMGTTFSLAGPFTVADQFPISCVTGGGGHVTVLISFSEITFSLGTGFFMNQGIDESGFNIVFGFDIDCVPATGGGKGIQENTFVSLLGTLEAAEAARSVPPTSCFFDAAAPRLIVAGTASGGGSRSVIVDAVSGTIVEDFGLFDVDGAAFDAFLLPSPTPGVGETFALCGTTGYHIGVDLMTCQLFPGVNLSSGFHEDTALIAQDPTLGTVSAVGNVIRRRQVDAVGGFVSLDSIFLQGGIRSVAAESSWTRFLTVTTSGNLQMVTNDGPTPTETFAAALGSLPRRLRWDPTSGLGGITDFVDDTVTLFTWDGLGLPVILGTAAVGQGPVGLDVLGHRVVCAGFDDDTWSLIEVDLAMGTFVTTTNPVPFAGTGPLQPGHAAFVRDANHSVCLSFFGAAALGFVPFAY